MTNNLESLILLNMVDSLGSVRLRALLERFGSPDKILKAKSNQLQAVPGIGKVISEGIQAEARGEKLKRELTLIEKNKVRVITMFDEDYPENLKTIYDPPMLLYIKGTLNQQADMAAVAVVGSRRASYYGLSTAEKLSLQLASQGWTVVSGLARGIDTHAHKGALKGKGRTIAVLGNGLARLYPPENKELSEKIAEQGCLCSEFPMETQPDRQNFPMRNRIISGLSLGVVVVEAAERSGALITADQALEQGREVFAVPGNVNSLNSRGANYLIKQGAKLIDDATDVIEELSTILQHRLKGLEKPETGKKQVSKKIIKEPVMPSPKLSEEEKNIFNTLESDPLHIDEVAERSKIPVARALGLLMQLEIKGLIRQLPGKSFVKK